MNHISRRDLLKLLAGAAGSAALPVPALGRLFSQTKPYEFLVAGDSLVWGQGLEEKDKFYYLTAEWLRRDVFTNGRDVLLKVKAHSGSTLKFQEDEAEKYRIAGRDETHPYPPEVNIGMPSVWKQIEVAADEYRRDGVSGADLIMMTGGITDISTAEVLNPNGDMKLLREQIKKHLDGSTYDVLEHAVRLHHNSLIAVVGYFHAISQYSDAKKLFNAWLEILKFPRALKFVPNNSLGRALFFNKLKRRAIERSRVWHQESSIAQQAAVDRLNAKLGATRAVFIGSPLTEKDAIEAPETRLFRMRKGGIVDDPVARQRINDCRISLPELKRSTGIDYPVRLCEAAAIGHPDQAGSRAYADAIIAKLSGHIR
ncbi:MAG: hypothetical protein IPM50_09525 [Acidobacteriota bacterium]|nr:MAG: hypothetical protein IPM50_09525 [Acidobacteriota bacterium]